MGLAKKLGQAAPRVTAPVSNAVPYKWSNQTYTMQDILKKFKFPCVVQCVTDSCTVIWSDFQFDLRQPLLLHEKRSVQKIHAISLKQDSHKPDGLEEIGPPLAVPQDYDGWFGTAPKGISKAKRHLRIEGVANSTARRFIVTSKCPAFTSCRGANGDLEYVPHDVMPGEVLKRVCVMDGNPGDPDAPQIVRDHGACLECLDEKDEHVVIPLSRRAITYEIAEMYPDDEDRVFQISAAIHGGNSKLPRILKLLHGDPPVLAYAFTGTVRCYSVFTEETIVAATLDDPTSICLELATDSAARFRLGLNEAAIRRTCEYINAHQICESFGPKFITGIKVSFSLKPEPSELDDIDLSFYESVSDMQEVDANSEFEIAWGSARKSKLLANSNNLTKEATASGESTDSILEMPEEEHIKAGTPSKAKLQSREPSVSSDGVVPQHRDFTENEIADLMSRKSLVVNSTDPEEVQTPAEIEELKENRVTDNPLFYYMQRNPDQNVWKSLGDNNSVSDESAKLSGDDEEKSSLEGDKEKSGLEDDTEKENPLLYLFQPPPVVSNVPENTQILISESKPESIDDVEQSAAMLGLGSDSETNLFTQAVCTPAKEYSEDDDDGLESDENDSVRSEDSEILEDVEIVIDSESPDTSLSQSNQTITEPTHFSHVSEQTDPSGRVSEDNDDEDDEFEAVDDLISLAEMESNKDTSSTLDLSVFPENENENTELEIEFHKETKDLVHTPTPNVAGPSREGEAVNRLNSLLDEVSELVNTSSGRILDVRKSPRLSKSSSNSSPKTEKDQGAFFEATAEVPVNATISDSTVSHSPSTSEDIHVPSEDSVSSIKLSEIKANLGHIETPNVKTMPKGKKSKIENGISFYTGLADSKKSKSEEFGGALKRAKGKTNLTSFSQTNADGLGSKNKSGSPLPRDRLHKFKSESNVSSIFAVEKDSQKKLESPNSLDFPHRPPYKDTDKPKIEKVENKPRRLSFDRNNTENHVSLSKAPRKNSLSKGIVFASVQNFETLGSSTSSINSNRSSGRGGSIQGSQNICVNSYQGLKSVEKPAALGVPKDSLIEAQTSTTLQPVENSSGENSEEEMVSFEEHYTVTKTGRLKLTRQNNPRKMVVLKDNLAEDFV